jgi:deoxyribodipyrimidine photo-lyase
LRVHDNPALSEAVRVNAKVIPLFVFDDTLLGRHGTQRRFAFLAGCLADLRRSLRSLGGDLVVRNGDPVAEASHLAAAHDARAVYMSADASAYAQRREQRLARERTELRIRDGISVVEPGALVPVGRNHFRVFTPYWRRWRAEPFRALHERPARIELPPGIDAGELADCDGGGETAARRRLAQWLRDGFLGYERHRERLAADATSRLSPYLHFGCLSPVEVAARTTSTPEFVRQLCWRDFFLQLLRANPQLEREDLHPRSEGWREDSEAFERWRAGATGVPIVDAAMRQLHREGWLPNRARIIVAGYLTKTLGLDWRLGARVFEDLLVDADVANNTGNWQWVAGTGVDTRPRGFNATRQAERFDPDGTYAEQSANA